MNDKDWLDPAAIARLHKFKGGAKFVAEMLDLFLSYAPEKLREALAAEQAGDLAGIKNAVHALKSSAGNVGARVVQDLAARLERLAAESNRDALPPLLRELEHAFAETRRRLEEIRGRLPP